MLNLSSMRMEIKKCPLWGFFYVAGSLSGIANNVPAYCRSCGFQHTSQRANGGKISNYFQTTVVPQLWQYAR